MGCLGGGWPAGSLAEGHDVHQHSAARTRHLDVWPEPFPTYKVSAEYPLGVCSGRNGGHPLVDFIGRATETE
jgi:hypothetical protein